MPQDRKAVAEARALQACIQVTTNPAEQNRLWNRYYALSDEVFPEAAALHRRYKSLEGEERHRFKIEYMELVRRLWAATDSEAAYPLSFSATPEVAPQPRFKVPNRVASSPPPPRRTRAPRVALAALVSLGLAAGVFLIWRAGQSVPAVSVEPATAAALPPATSTTPAESAPNPAPEATVESPVASTPPEAPVPPSPPAQFDPPLAKIDAELAAEIQPQFVALPEELKGRGDHIDFPGGRHEDVYIIESDSLYYVRLPDRGVVESISRDGARATISADGAGREAILAIWKQNREAIAQAAQAREKEKVQRIASYRRAYEKQLAEHEKAEAAAWRQSRAADWLALGPEQRGILRARAYDNWSAIQTDVEKVRELYVMISRAYASIGINDERVNELTAAYNQASRERGPNYDVENALIQYGWERQDWMRMVVEWEKEYYRLNEYLQKNYPPIEKRVEEIKQLDESLPAEVRVAEEMVNWERALEPREPTDPAGGMGTGFVVAPGLVMTCAHVVRTGGAISVASGTGQVHDAKVHTLDMANDWAVLAVNGLQSPPIPVATGKPNVGATIYCIGYPLGGIRDSTDPIVGSGNIAALKRLDGDERYMQITAPVNPGNSGGPVLDQHGRWVGIVSQKLNDRATLEAADTVAQGVNFAIKATFVQPLLQPKGGLQIASAPAPTGPPMNLETLVQQLAPSIVRIEVR